MEDALAEVLAAPTDTGRPRSRNTGGKVRRLLIGAWDRAARAGEVAGVNPARIPDAMAEERDAEPRWLDVEEATKVLAELDGHPWRAAYILVATVGPGRGEVLGLTWQRVDLERGVVRLGPTVTRTVSGTVVHTGPKTEAGGGPCVSPRSRPTRSADTPPTSDAPTSTCSETRPRGPSPTPTR